MKKIKAIFEELNSLYKNNVVGMTCTELSQRLQNRGIIVAPHMIYSYLYDQIERDNIGKLRRFKKGKGKIIYDYYSYFITDKGNRYIEKKYNIKSTRLESMRKEEEERKRKVKRFGLFALLLLATTAYYLITK
jgi:hypothetical protein